MNKNNNIETMNNYNKLTFGLWLVEYMSTPVTTCLNRRLEQRK